MINQRIVTNMPLKENLELAQRAIEYTRETVIYGSDNRKEDDKEPERKESSQKAQTIIRESLDDYARNRRQARRAGHDIRFTFLDEIRLTASEVKQYKAGNCDFQAYVAFEWILANSDIRPVSIIFIPNDSGPAAHCMVGIGDLSNADDAVLCDPHQIQCYPLSAFYAGEYEGLPIGACQYGDKLAVRFKRSSQGSITEKSLNPADEEYHPAELLETETYSTSCSM
ncbi:MAG: hypothetical protein Q8M03_15340 [Legionella sp.]|nr:hypothetical protein [Legionella sp.]